MAVICFKYMQVITTFIKRLSLCFYSKLLEQAGLTFCLISSAKQLLPEILWGQRWFVFSVPVSVWEKKGK